MYLLFPAEESYSYKDNSAGNSYFVVPAKKINKGAIAIMRNQFISHFDKKVNTVVNYALRDAKLLKIRCVVNSVSIARILGVGVDSKPSFGDNDDCIYPVINHDEKRYTSDILPKSKNHLLLRSCAYNWLNTRKNDR
jgi:hypothetical protein